MAQSRPGIQTNQHLGVYAGRGGGISGGTRVKVHDVIRWE